MKSETEISKLSSHLFWDVDRAELRFEDHKKFIVQRVLEYGLLSDWITLVHYYGKNELVNIALNLRSLNKRALAFMAAYAAIPKEEFKCYTTKQSIPQHWSY